MKKQTNKRRSATGPAVPDTGSDKTRKNTDSDKTVKRTFPGKSKLEQNPDSTGTDTKADKMRKGKSYETTKKK
ncbi:MAG: hypothetical protein FD123_4140 [Bacteroidetes bacterium]|nr:MAG: hypothetical protein FD123_4140 [Bacteroidota bacterium]